MKTVNGWAYPDIDEFMAAEMKADGTYQAGHLRQALAHVVDWSVAVDGGAHVGTWTRLMAAKFGRIVAFEPSADTYEALQANLATFGCANVTSYNAALGADHGTVVMVLDGRGAELKNTGSRYVREGGPVPRLPLDSLNLPTLGFLKLDVEGSEPLAIRGALETLRRCRPIVLFEHKGFCRRYGLPPDATQQELLGAGYKQLEVAGKDLIWGPA